MRRIIGALVVSVDGRTLRQTTVDVNDARSRERRT
jgi:hypothetical protein